MRVKPLSTNSAMAPRPRCFRVKQAPTTEAGDAAQAMNTDSFDAIGDRRVGGNKVSRLPLALTYFEGDFYLELKISQHY